MSSQDFEIQEAWITWECPECQEEHDDPDLLLTHCRKCGLVVLSQEGVGISQNWHIPPSNLISETQP